MSDFLSEVRKRIVVFDGAMGTSLQNMNLTPDDFDGLDGCNEYLVLSKPEAIRQVHAGFLEVGCQVVETDTFGATSVVLAEYDIPEKSYEINKKAAALANEVTGDYSTRDFPRFVAGSIGPGTKLPTLGHIGYDDLKKSYDEQVAGLVDGGADLLIIETSQDLLQAKTVLASIMDYFKKIGRRIPVITKADLLDDEFLSLKEETEADVLAMQCGDFYEFFGEDAETVADVVDEETVLENLNLAGAQIGAHTRIANGE